MRLIDADALVEKLSDKAKEMLGIAEQCQGSAINYYTGAKYGFAKAAIIANNFPPIEPKHGKWINDKGLYRCTACNNLLTVAGWDIPEEQIYKSFKFCPNCGAKMERSGRMWITTRSPEGSGKKGRRLNECCLQHGLP